MQTRDCLRTIVFRVRKQWDYCCDLLIYMVKTTVRSLGMMMMTCMVMINYKILVPYHGRVHYPAASHSNHTRHKPTVMYWCNSDDKVTLLVCVKHELRSLDTPYNTIQCNTILYSRDRKQNKISFERGDLDVIPI